MFIYYRFMRMKDENKYNAIIKASLASFMKEGFAKASIAKIAKAADVSPATIYIYFENKEDLITKLYQLLRKEMSEIVLGDIHLEGCLETAYKKMWMNYYHYCLNHHDEFTYIMQYSNSPYAKKNTYSEDTVYFSKIYDFFSKGKELNQIKQVSDEILFAYTFYPASQLAKRNRCCGSKLCSQGVENACQVAWDAVSQCKSGVKCVRMNDDLIQRLVKIFKNGEKKSEYLGVEFEHFLIDRQTLRSYDYFESNGQFDIVKSLKTVGWSTAYEENGYILAVEKEGNQISFEPGGQFEISIKPCKDIYTIDKTYQSVLQDINQFLKESQALVSLGYHPKTRIDDLPLLPKERYKHMYEYLHKQGTMARNMMKGTASTQVSIDFENEEDFTIKYRVANFLSPFIARMFDASPVFEGEFYPAKNLRLKIWEHTDISRCKMPSGVMDTTFDYRAYADYISNIQPILMPTETGTRFTGERTVGQLARSNYLKDEDLEHVISMVFPDVRLKNFIEIRIADALPYPYSLALPALIKAIFYNKELLHYYYDISKHYSDDDINKMYHQLMDHYDFEFDCLHEKTTCSFFIDDLLNRSQAALGEEGEYIAKFHQWINTHHSFASHMKSIYGSEAFLAFLEGN